MEAIGVAGELPAGHTAIGETARRSQTGLSIDQLFEVGIQTVLACGDNHEGFDDMPKIAWLHMGAVLDGTQECGDLSGVVSKLTWALASALNILLGWSFRICKKPWCVATTQRGSAEAQGFRSVAYPNIMPWSPAPPLSTPSSNVWTLLLSPRCQYPDRHTAGRRS
jgi:hypothetical protein